MENLRSESFCYPSRVHATRRAQFFRHPGDRGLPLRHVAGHEGLEGAIERNTRDCTQRNT